MNVCNTNDRYGVVAMGLHWLIAVAIIGMIILGWVMTDQKPGSPEQVQLFQLHKSVGITILVLTLVRIVWRLINPIPPLPSHMVAWERIVARVTHIGFYVLMLALPISGWMIVSTSSFNIPTMLYGVVELPNLPVLSTLENKKPVHEALEGFHEFFANCTLFLLALHVVGALKHHFVDHDTVLSRMMPFARRQAMISRSPK